MTSGRDDDALSWGDDDPTLDVGSSDAARDATLGLPTGYRAVGKGSRPVEAEPPAVEADDAVDPAERQQLSNATLVFLGIFGGVYLLYAVGWLIGGLRLQDAALFVVTPAMYQPALVLAVLAPLLWFLAALYLTRARATWLRVLWLIAGALLLVPWPFIAVGAVGS
ncbi:DNA polymerase III subunit gamma/tau [Microbacterium sp. SLBN-146]|uniref:DNA polymerase III subunit gamma/tau n=1 Tax=Microbacterium sp. SLBN-146 TaxID=2768457 RepID=UPI00115393FB|nr:DNA polymerase III subunit gamma/tau [Microbacterium sp. SLBN-146]TQJ31870.1 hypothetical protein FBY39_2357 [Microbacterium sp. SLBN-146]